MFTFGESAGGALALTVGYAAARERPMSSWRRRYAVMSGVNAELMKLLFPAALGKRLAGYIVRFAQTDGADAALRTK